MTEPSVRQRPKGALVFVALHALLYVWMVASMFDTVSGIRLLNALAAVPVIVGLLLGGRIGWWLCCGGSAHLCIGYFLLYAYQPSDLTAYAYAIAFSVAVFTLGFLSRPAWQEIFGMKDKEEG
ncbi:hypothetical protein ACFLU6_02730 [Acidobacteriota bacterium]